MTDNKLDFWISKNYNVLFKGRHGVGKSAIILEAFKRNNLKFKYFSTSTLDPWVDFVGVPKEVKDANGNSHLDLIRPKWFADDDVEAIFLDEYNRCLTGDTKILCLDGKSYAIKDLVGKEYFYTYSYNHKTKNICAGKGHSARVTQQNAKIIKVNLDNGTSIRCTGDHPFLLKNGSYKEAKDLTIEDSLMPLYKIWNKNGYEKIYQLVSIEDAGIEDVYDITVDEHHNFALEAGVFVHNSQPKIRNATMELIQFKSINGRKFNNLKIIWAAVNPDKEDGDTSSVYDVDIIDPAQLDRFEIQVDVPYKPSYGYFMKAYNADIAKVAIDWWHELNEEQKNAVSPRRLDYAMRMYTDGGDLRDILPKQVSVSKLIAELKNGSYREKMTEILKAQDTARAAVFIGDKINFENTIKYIEGDSKALEFYMPYFTEENQVKYITSSKAAQNLAFDNYNTYTKAIQAAAVSSKKVKNALDAYIKAHPVITNSGTFATFTFANCNFSAKNPLSRINDGDTVNNMMHRAGVEINSAATRYALYRDLMTAVRVNHGYNSGHTMALAHVKLPLTLTECEFLLGFLHTIIDNARMLNPLSDVVNFYGMVSKVYLTQYNKRLQFDVLSQKVKSFITTYSAEYQ